MAARVGTKVGERYRITAPLAEGGMGMVFEGVDEETGEAVAIKLLRDDLEGSEEALVRFQREAEAAQRIAARQIVAVHDTGRTADGVPYMVMDRLRGRDLGAILAEGPLEEERIIRLMLELLDGLSRAHAAGIVHRDLKPSNVFVTDGEEVKILDFGIAKVFDDAKVQGGETGKLTSTQAVLGSPAYMSPEQLVSAKYVDGRTDIWSLGVIMHELVTGRTLFDADTVGAIFTQVVKMEIPSVSAFRRDVHPGLARIIGRCLERDTAQRYATVADLAVDLSASSSADPPRLPEPTGPAAPAAGTATHYAEAAMADTIATQPPPSMGTATTVAQPSRSDRAKRGWKIGGALGLVLVAAVTAFFATRDRAADDRPAPATTAKSPLSRSAPMPSGRSVEAESPAASGTGAVPEDPAPPDESASASDPEPPPSMPPPPWLPVPPPVPPEPAAPPPDSDDGLWENSRH